jgi:hypothetical protein
LLRLAVLMVGVRTEFLTAVVECWSAWSVTRQRAGRPGFDSR